MGGGDVKLFAMIGAFLGWQSLLGTLLFASLGGSVIGLTVMFVKGVGRRYPIPFGPFLCLGALLFLFFGNELTAFYLYSP
jgi:leader peptidase (prepilin peptidase)/N-methyltransferase